MEVGNNAVRGKNSFSTSRCMEICRPILGQNDEYSLIHPSSFLLSYLLPHPFFKFLCCSEHFAFSFASQSWKLALEMERG